MSKFKIGDKLSLLDVKTGEDYNGLFLSLAMYNRLKELEEIIVEENREDAIKVKGLPFYYGKDIFKLKVIPRFKLVRTDEKMIDKVKVVNEDGVDFIIADPYVHAISPRGFLVTAYCSPRDKFDEEKGKEVALQKLLIKHKERDIEDFKRNIKRLEEEIEDIEKKLKEF